MPFLGCPGQPDAILQPTEIGHYFCGIFPLLRVASADTDITAALVVAFSGIVSLINFVILCVSHNILLFTLQNHSAGETQTPLCLWASCRCGVSLLAPVSFACLRPPAPYPLDKTFALFYTIIASLFNPFICTLRNSEMPNAMRKV